MGFNKVLQKHVIPALLLAKKTRDIPFSFETAEQGNIDIYFTRKSKILFLRTVVLKALADTDAGTITAKNSAGTGMSGGVVTIALSAVIGEKDSATPTTNNIVAKDDFARFTTAKTTPGGHGILTIEYQEIG